MRGPSPPTIRETPLSSSTRPSHSKVGITEVARHAGVSPGTVSNVLNRPERVAAGTRQRVERAIAELDYVRNSSGSSLRSGRSSSVGLLVLDVTNPFFTEVSRGVEDEAATQGLAVVLLNSAEARERQRRNIRLLAEQRGVPVEETDDLPYSCVGLIHPRYTRGATGADGRTTHGTESGA